jgi:hypothetical protein
VCIIDTKQHKKNKPAAATNDEDIAQEGRPNNLFTTVIWIASFNQFAKFYLLPCQKYVT